MSHACTVCCIVSNKNFCLFKSHDNFLNLLRMLELDIVHSFINDLNRIVNIVLRYDRLVALETVRLYEQYL